MKTRVYSCTSENCFMSFRDLGSLENHQKTHVNEIVSDPRDFTCHKCNRKLSTKQSLKEHSFTHSGKKPFRCSEIGCGKMFRQSSQLCNHRKVHKEAKKMMKIKSRSDPATKFFSELMSSIVDSNSSRDLTNGDDRIILPPITCPKIFGSLPKIASFN